MGGFLGRAVLTLFNHTTFSIRTPHPHKRFNPSKYPPSPSKFLKKLLSTAPASDYNTSMPAAVAPSRRPPARARFDPYDPTTARCKPATPTVAPIPAPTLTPEYPPSTDFSSVSVSWFVCQTKSRCEKALIQALSIQALQALCGKGPTSAGESLSYFLPLVQTPSKTLIPLFNGIAFIGYPTPPAPIIAALDRAALPQHDPLYQPRLPADLYALADLEARNLNAATFACRATRYAYSFLYTRNQPRLRKELALLALTLPADRLANNYNPLVDRCPVRFREGPLKGLEGFVTKNPTNHSAVRVYVELHLLGRKVSTETSLENLEPVLY